MKFVLVFVLFAFVAFDSSAQKREVTIVIDPGHGGTDPGHLSTNPNHLTEKELNLKIATYLGNYIEQYLQNVRVIYTRTTDTYPSLDDRVNVANNNKADYFISVHCNGNDRQSVHGTETHVHSMDLSKSVKFANAIEKQFSSRAGRKSRGVKDEKDLQHSLQVLKYTNMTSILVECGFLTNEKEAAFLNTTYGQEIIASAIFRGFRETIESEHPTIAFRKTTPTVTTSNSTAATSVEVYTVQIASSKEPIATDDHFFRKLGQPVNRKELNTSSAYKYIYTVGKYATQEDAKVALESIQKKGFKDAFVLKQ